MNLANQSTARNTNDRPITTGLLDHLLDCLFSNQSPNDSLTKRFDTLVQELELFEPPKILDHNENLKFINLRAKFQRLRIDNLKKTEAQDDKTCATSKSLSGRVIALIERLFSLPELPEDIWKNQILPMLKLATPSSPITMTLGKMQINRQMDKLVTETMLKVVESERCSLKLVGCTTADDAINFVIRYQLSVANLKEFPDLTDDHLKRLSEQCPQLKHLAISSTNVTEVPKIFALQSLDLSRCENLTDAGLANLPALQSLISLDLSYCHNLKDAGFVYMESLTALESLNLADCYITGAGLAQLIKLRSLTSLDLRECEELEDEGLACLPELPALTSLFLEYSNNLTDAGLAHVGKLTTLKSLYIHACDSLTDAGIVLLGKLTGLKSLYIHACDSLTDAGIVYVGKLTGLESLTIKSLASLTGAGFAELPRLRSLKSLDLSNCKDLPDEVLVYVGKLKTLESLNLSGCQELTDASLLHVLALPVLERIGLNYACRKLTPEGLAILNELKPLLRIVDLEK